MAITFDQAFARFISECPYVVAVRDLITKWRIELTGGYLLDIYYNDTVGKYSYTLVKGDQRIMGWDNAPHHPGISNFPHHVHHIDGSVEMSKFTGDPEHDLEELIHELEVLLGKV